MKTSVSNLLKTSFIALSLCAFLGDVSEATVTAGGTVGDSAVYTAASAGETMAAATGEGLNGTDLDHTFDTPAGTACPTYEWNPNGNNNAEIALSSGRHLVLYNSNFDHSGNGNRSEVHGNLNLAGTDLAAGFAQGFNRNNGTASECIVSGGAIIDVASDDDILKLQTFRTDDNGGATVTRLNGLSGIQLLKLDDSWDYLSLSRSAADQSPVVSGADVDVTYDTDLSPGTHGTAFSFTATSGDITLNETGLYLVMANTGLEDKGTQNATRTTYSQQLTLGGTAVPGTFTTTYLRGNQDGEDVNNGVATIGTILDVTTGGQTLNVEITKEKGDDATIIQDRTAITIIKLPATAEFFSVSDATTQDVNDSGAVAFGTAGATSSEFSHTPGAGIPTNSEVTVNSTSKYLFLGRLFVNDETSDRVVASHGWSVDNGAMLAYGQGAEYNRNNATDEDFSSSWNGAVLPLLANQTVEMVTAPLDGVTAVANIGERNLQALSIKSLLSIPVRVFSEETLTVINTTGVAIGANLLSYADGNDTAADLTYTLTSDPSGGTLKLSGGTLNNGGTFTQTDIDAGNLTFDAGATATTGGFNFTVDDSAGNNDGSATGSFVIEVISPIANVSIASDGDVSEAALAGFTVTTDFAPGAGGIDVNLTYSGTAEDGSDFTGQAMVNIVSGATTADLDLPTVSDGLLEGTETIIVTIDSLSSTTTSPVVGSPSSATLTLLDGSNAAPMATNLDQVLSGSGTIDLENIVVSDPDDFESEYATATTPLFDWAGATGVTTFDPAIPGGPVANQGNSFDIDALADALVESAGFSFDIVFQPKAADLTGTVQIWEIGGTSNGSGIYLVDGIPHLLSKAGGAASNAPTDGADPGFVDLDWDPDNTIAVPLTDAPLPAGQLAEIAMAFDINGDTVTYSTNGAASATANLSAQSGLNFLGDHTVNIGTGAGSGSGASNSGGGTFGSGNIGNLAGGPAAVQELRFWNEATGTTGPPAALVPDQITVTITIPGWISVATHGEITDLNDMGNGVYSLTDTTANINAALSDAQFITGTSTADTTLLTVTVDDGNEDGGGALSGTIAVTTHPLSPVYVDDDFSGSYGDPVADGDLGDPGIQAASFGITAFDNLTDALAAVQATGTIIVNDGDYSAETAALPDTVTLQLTDTAGPVVIGSVSSPAGPAIDLQSNTLETGNGAGDDTIACIISGTGGSLTKKGTDLLILSGENTYSGTTTVDEGILRIMNNSLANGALPTGPVVTNARLEFSPAENTTIERGDTISGTGLVAPIGRGTLHFTNAAAANTFSGGFVFGQATGSLWSGPDPSGAAGTGTGNKRGFVIFNHNNHLGDPGTTILSRGGQLRAGTTNLTIPNDIDVTNGGLRCGGDIDFAFSGTITPLLTNRGFGNYGGDALDLTIAAPGGIDLSNLSAGNAAIFQGINNDNNGSWTVSGNITGSPGKVTVDTSFDDGEVTFSGANDYTGVTLVQAGATMIYDNATYTGGGAHTVEAGGTMTGSADLGTAALTVGGTLSPGSNGSPGTFTTGDLTINGTLEVDLDNNTPGTGHDQVIANGAVTLGGTSSLAVNAGAGLTPGTLILIANDDGTDAVTGIFTGLAEGAALDAAALGFDATATYQAGGGDNNDVALAFTDYTTIGGWRVANYGTPANSGAGENNATSPSSLENIQAFTFGFDKNGAGHSGGHTVGGMQIIDDTANSGNFYLQYPRRQDYATEVTITEEFSRLMNEGTWDAVSTGLFVETTVTSTATNGVDVDIIRVPFPSSLPTTGGKARQGRVAITAP